MPPKKPKKSRGRPRKKKRGPSRKIQISDSKHPKAARKRRKSQSQRENRAAKKPKPNPSRPNQRILSSNSSFANSESCPVPPVADPNPASSNFPPDARLDDDDAKMFELPSKTPNHLKSLNIFATLIPKPQRISKFHNPLLLKF